MKTRKTITMRLTISVPIHMRDAQVRQEIRSLIDDQCNWPADEGEINVRALGPERQAA